MKAMKKAISVILVAALVLQVGVVSSADVAQAAKKASLKTKKMTLTVGSKKSISIKNKKSKNKYTFKSSKKSVATVSSKGKITAKKAGKAKITVKETYKVKKKKKTRSLGAVTVTVKAKAKATPAPTKKPVKTATPVATPDPVLTQAKAKSLLSTGNNVRLKKMIDKAKKGETINIACIGGSITKGTGGDKTTCYVGVFRTLMQKAYGAKVNVLNAGLPGTPSTVGWMRYYKDVEFQLGAKPDMVVIEFSVNDGDDSDVTGGECFESMIKGILNMENAPAVALMFATFHEGWYTRQDMYAPIGTAYGVGMVSTRDAVKSLIDSKLIGEEDFFNPTETAGKQLHPSVLGHKIMGNCLFNYVQQAYAKATDAADITMPTPVIGDTYSNLVSVFPGQGISSKVAGIELGGFTVNKKADYDVWTHQRSTTEAFTITANCKAFMLTYREKTSEDAGGKLEIYVDGVLTKTIDAYKSLDDGGWDHCIADVAFKSSESAEHKIELKMAEDSVDKNFDISYIGICK